MEEKKITHIPTVLKEAEKALEKLEGTEEYPVMKELFEALGTSFRKRAYGYNLNELYTVSEMLKSKKITADDLAELLIRIQTTGKSKKKVLKTHEDTMNIAVHRLDDLYDEIKARIQFEECTDFENGIILKMRNDVAVAITALHEQFIEYVNSIYDEIAS
jgi:transcriptional accessory protein Tex/SPT6